MQRGVLLFLVVAIVVCAAVPAQAVITVSFGNHTIQQGTSKVIPVTITATEGEELNAADLYLQVEDGNTGPLPFATAIELLTGCIFGAVSSTTSVYNDPWEVYPGDSLGDGDSSTGYKPAYAVFTNATSGPNADVPATGTLAFVTFSAEATQGVVPIGDYNVSLTMDDLGDTLLALVTGPLEPGVDYFLEPGTITVFIPEPSSVVLGLFAAAGLAAVGIRRCRSRKAA
jgi:hypothetical protein